MSSLLTFVTSGDDNQPLQSPNVFLTTLQRPRLTGVKLRPSLGPVLYNPRLFDWINISASQYSGTLQFLAK